MNDQPDNGKLPALVSGGAIQPIVPTSIEEAWRISVAVVKAGMNPPGLKTPEQCMIVIMHGLEVGMPPMMSLQSIALINGRPSIYGDGALGLVYGSGKLQTIKEELLYKDDNRVAVCTVVRRGDPEPKVRKFSVADAKRAALWTKGDAWTKYPERMLQMRARSWALRDGFADVLKGLAIAEEQRDITLTATPIPPTPPMPTPAPEKVAEMQNYKAPPKPPKPPAKKQEPEPEPEIIDPETGEVQMPGDLLSALDDALATAPDVATLEEIWNDHDIEAMLESMPHGGEFTGVALGIKRRHLKRLNA